MPLKHDSTSAKTANMAHRCAVPCCGYSPNSTWRVTSHDTTRTVNVFL